MSEQIFITGTTGCIGHYVLHEIRRMHPNAQLHLMARRPERYQVNVSEWDNVTLYPITMSEVDQLKQIMPKMDYVIHIATVWGYNLEENIELNRDKTIEMFNYCDPNRLKRIIYFSTASILTQGNQLNEVAKTDGIPYVQSKYYAYEAIKKSKFSDRIITLFPTVVLGGGDGYPYSHISSGLKELDKTLKWVQYLKLDGRFHFLHAKDIAANDSGQLNTFGYTK